MIKNEYLRFMRSLASENTSANVHKMANLIYENFNEIQPLGTAQGQRVKKLVQLALKRWSIIKSVPPDIVIDEHQIGNSVRKLKSINIGPFRGFAKEELLTLHSSLVLIYGPNGTGKSSFCEALEYSLLGSVVEAESKRFKNQSEYLKNAYTNSFNPPKILGVDEGGTEIYIQPNESQYRFCFVEKNRIDNFSRIAAQAPAKQTELVSTLFGLDAFNEFVKNFSSEIDGKYIDLVGAKALILTCKQQTLAGYKQQIKEHDEIIKIIESDETALGKRYRDDCAYNQLVLEINGNEQNVGSITRLEKELQQPLPVKTGLSILRFNLIRKELDENIAELHIKQKELAELSQQVSFKQLYESLIQLQTNNSDVCPACKTPLDQTKIDPYKNANKELTKLQHLSVLEYRIEEIKLNKRKYLIEISQIINKICSQYTENVVHNYKVESDEFATDDWYASLFQPLSDNFTVWQHLEVQIKDQENKDNIIEEVIKSREQKQKDLARAK